MMIFSIITRKIVDEFDNLREEGPIKVCACVANEDVIKRLFDDCRQDKCLICSDEIKYKQSYAGWVVVINVDIADRGAPSALRGNPAICTECARAGGGLEAAVKSLLAVGWA
jgi:hypothetical protein